MGTLAISPVTAMVVHEIKNPLGVIRGCAELLKLENPDIAEDDSLNGIIDGVERIASVMDTVLSLAHRPAQTRDRIDLTKELPLVRQFLILAQRPKPEVILDVAEGLPEVCISASDLEQILLNILANACQAQDGLPEVIITTEYLPGGPKKPRKNRKMACTTPLEEWSAFWPVGRAAVGITIADSGCGIPEDILSQLFQEQITTKAQGSGTGLGMLLCRELLNIWNGTLHMESRVGVGTISRVYLPVC